MSLFQTKRNFIIACAVLLSGCSSHDDTPHEHAKSIDELAGIEKVDIAVAASNYNHITAYRRGPRVTVDANEKLRVIIIPGSPSNINFWGEAIWNIDDRAEVYAIERPGYRGSGPGYAVTQISEQAESIRLLVEDYDGEIIVIGQSYGAAVTVMALRLYGGSIDGIVLVSPYIIPMRGEKKFWFGAARFSPLRYVGGPTTNKIVRELAAYRKQSGLVMSIVKSTCAPVQILHGASDDLVPVDDAYEVKAMFPECASAHLDVSETGDHYLQVHSLDWVSNKINAFIGNLMEISLSGRRTAP